MRYAAVVAAALAVAAATPGIARAAAAPPVSGVGRASPQPTSPTRSQARRCHVIYAIPSDGVDRFRSSAPGSRPTSPRIAVAAPGLHPRAALRSCCVPMLPVDRRTRHLGCSAAAPSATYAAPTDGSPRSGTTSSRPLLGRAQEIPRLLRFALGVGGDHLRAGPRGPANGGASSTRRGLHRAEPEEHRVRAVAATSGRRTTAAATRRWSRCTADHTFGGVDTSRSPLSPPHACPDGSAHLRRKPARHHAESGQDLLGSTGRCSTRQRRPLRDARVEHLVGNT